jgi:hypothetical protein
MGNYSFDFGFVKSGAPIVTLNSLGIAFNRLSRSMLGFPDRINVGYDDHAQVIGIQAHDDSSLDYYEFESKEKNDWVRIGCKDFIRYLSHETDLDFTKAIQFIATLDEETKTLIVVVDEDHMKK